jgi:hypothetical protein
MNHDLFLADIVTSMPEIGGAFLFSPQDGVLATHSGNASVSFNSLAVAEKMAAVAAMASNQFQDLTQLQVSFDTIILSGRLLPDGNWLCLLYTPDLSVGMIRMALQIALNNSAQGHHGETSPASPPVQEAPVTEQLPPQEAPRAEIAVDTDALLAPGAPLAGILNVLQGGLAHCIGPVAVPVFHELLVAWCQNHTPSTETMKHLITLIEEEIDDEESVKGFHNKIKNILPQE